VNYTIVDGEHEYGDSFSLLVQSGDEEKQAIQELAAFYATDPKQKLEIVKNLTEKGSAMIGCRGIKNVSVEEPVTVTICVRGGIIQDIQNLPPGIQIRIQDYDIDNLTEKELLEETETDGEGKSYRISFWETE
jgi:hypothetical protein